MSPINKAKLTEADIISKFLLPAVKAAGWDDLIVSKVERLLLLCGLLKSRLQTSQQTQLALAESLVEGALA